MPIGTIIGLGLAGASSVLGLGANLWQNKKTRSFNASEAEKARQFSSIEVQIKRSLKTSRSL